MWFMMENFVKNKHSGSIIKFHNHITAIIAISTFTIIAK
jgi:hypothetical protein